MNIDCKLVVERPSIVGEYWSPSLKVKAKKMKSPRVHKKA